MPSKRHLSGLLPLGQGLFNVNDFDGYSGEGDQSQTYSLFTPVSLSAASFLLYFSDLYIPKVKHTEVDGPFSFNHRF